MKSNSDIEARYYLAINPNFNFERSKQKEIISTKLLTVMAIIAIGTFSVSLNFAYGQSDFYLEGIVDSSNVSNSFNAMGQNTSGLNITKLEFRGDALKSICPSQQCTIQYINEPMSPSDPLRSSAYILDYFSEPALDDSTIDYIVHFNIKDAIIDPDVGPKKRQYLEEHYVSQFSCTLNDIIEDNGQEVYYCDGSPSLIRKFDSKTWHFDTIGKYDAKRHIYTESGNYTPE